MTTLQPRPAADAAPLPVEALPAGLSPLRRARGRGPVRGRLALLGPAFVAAVAYIDPGNFATNFSAGAKFGYLLVWVIVMANLMAMLVQYLSAKAGLASGRNLAELCRESFPRSVNGFLWVQAEIVAIATDLAEFVGAAIGLHLLFGIGLFPAGLITAVVAFAILALEQRGYRRFELAIIGLLGLVALGFLYDFVAVGNHDAAGIAGGLVPSLGSSEALLLAMGIIGATVMPHVIYLHSALTQRRIEPADDGERRELLRWVKIDCGLGLGMAGLINLAMLCIAVAVLHRRAIPRSTRSRARTTASRRSSAEARRWRSRSRCWPRVCRRRASARTPARSSWRDSSAAGSRCSCAAR